MELSVLADAKDVPNIDPIMARYGHGGTVIEQVQSCQILPQFLIKAYLPNSRAYKAQRLQLEQELTASGKEATILKERRLEPDQAVLGMHPRSVGKADLAELRRADETR